MCAQWSTTEEDGAAVRQVPSGTQWRGGTATGGAPAEEEGRVGDVVVAVTAKHGGSGNGGAGAEQRDTARPQRRGGTGHGRRAHGGGGEGRAGDVAGRHCTVSLRDMAVTGVARGAERASHRQDVVVLLSCAAPRSRPSVKTSWQTVRRQRVGGLFSGTQHESNTL